MKKIILVVFMFFISVVVSYAGYLMPIPDGFCTVDYYCSYQFNFTASGQTIPDDANYRFHTLLWNYPLYSLTLPLDIQYPDISTQCHTWVQVLYPCFSPRSVNQDTVPEYVVRKINPVDSYWGDYKINCVTEPSQRALLVDNITMKFNYYRGLYGGVPAYPSIYPGHNKTFFITLIMYRSVGGTEELSNDVCLAGTIENPLFTYVLPSIKYSVAFTGVGGDLKRGGYGSGQSKFHKGIVSKGKGLGGYEVRH